MKGSQKGEGVHHLGKFPNNPVICFCRRLGVPNWGSMSGILFQLLAQIEQNSKIPTASLAASTTPAADKGKHNLNPPLLVICVRSKFVVTYEKKPSNV